MTDIINNTYIADQTYRSDIAIKFTSNNIVTNRGFKIEFTTTGMNSYIRYVIKPTYFCLIIHVSTVNIFSSYVYCRLENCKVGPFSSWTWSYVEGSCGNGVRTRSIIAQPNYGGDPCPRLTETTVKPCRGT